MCGSVICVRGSFRDEGGIGVVASEAVCLERVTLFMVEGLG